MSDAELITAALADIASLRAARQDAFQRGWKAGIEAAAKAASWAHMVPPDGGSPTEGERLVAEAAADAIRSLTPPEDMS